MVRVDRTDTPARRQFLPPRVLREVRPFGPQISLVPPAGGAHSTTDNSTALFASMLGRNVGIGKIVRYIIISTAGLYLFFMIATFSQPRAYPYPTPTPRLTNKCTKRLLDPPRPYTRIPTMVAYVHYQESIKKDQNFLFFLRYVKYVYNT
jgi:hypothetical protein